MQFCVALAMRGTRSQIIRSGMNRGCIFTRRQRFNRSSKPRKLLSKRRQDAVRWGFRGPGFSVSETVIQVLILRGYVYDASTLPTFLGPLARAYYFFNAKLDAEEKKKRAKLFGTLSDGLRPIKSHTWKSFTGSITEIPVTTVPIVRTPFHLSYLIYLHSFSPALATAYMHMAFSACRWANVQPSFLLHPLDFLGRDESPELAFFPGMKMPAQEKLRLAGKTFSALADRFTLVSMKEHAMSFQPAA